MELKDSCAQNLHFSVNGRPAKVAQSSNNNMFISYESGDDVVMAKHAFEREYREGKIFRIQEKQHIDRRLNLTFEQHQEKVRIDEYLTRLHEITGGKAGGVQIRKAVAIQVWHLRGSIEGDKPSATTLWRWHKAAERSAYGSAGIVAKLKRERKSKYDGEVRTIAKHVIDTHYKQLAEPSISSSYWYVCVTAIDDHGIEDLPSYTTFRNWILEEDPLEVIGARQSKKALKQAKRAVLGQHETIMVLERVEADAGHFNIGVTDDNDKLIARSVTLYVLMDCHSRSVLGFFLQIGRGESTSSVLESFIHAIAPKDPTRYHYCESDYPMHGSPLRALIDGGSGYTDEQAMAFYTEANIIPVIVETNSGDKKPFVESFIKTLRIQLFKEIPGYCGKYADGRQLEAPVDKQAVMRFSDLERIVAQYIIDVYHHTPHSGLGGKTPYQVWQQNSAEFHKYVSLPPNFNILKTMRGEVDERTVDHHGVSWSGINYHSRQLAKYYADTHQPGMPNPKVLVEFNHNDISEVTVVDKETGEVVLANAVDNSIYEGMSLAQYKLLNPPSETHSEDKLNSARQMRKLREQHILADARSAHAARIEEARHSSIRMHQADAITERVHNNRLFSQATPSSTEPDESSVPASHEEASSNQSWDAKEFGLD